jgi:hypothetical protein
VKRNLSLRFSRRFWQIERRQFSPASVGFLRHGLAVIYTTVKFDTRIGEVYIARRLGC